MNEMLCVSWRVNGEDFDLKLGIYGATQQAAFDDVVAGLRKIGREVRVTRKVEDWVEVR